MRNVCVYYAGSVIVGTMMRQFVQVGSEREVQRRNNLKKYHTNDSAKIARRQDEVIVIERDLNYVINTECNKIQLGRERVM